MKRIKGWDSYVAESGSREDRAIEVPISEDEVYIVDYPTRRQGQEMAAAQQTGDVDALLVALLGAEAGGRVAELSADEPGFVLDEFLIDVMRAFGFLEEDVEATRKSLVQAGKSTTTRASGSTAKRGTRTKKSAAVSS